MKRASDAPPDEFVVHPPKHPGLHVFFSSVWCFRGHFSHRFERGLPGGATQLLINLDADRLSHYRDDGVLLTRTGGVAVAGIRCAPVILDTSEQRSVCGAVFSPTGASAYLGLPARFFANELLDMTLVQSSGWRVARERLLDTVDVVERLNVLESILWECSSGASTYAPHIDLACRRIERGESIADVRNELGLSAHRLIGEFRTRVGLAPKRYGRLARFQRTLDRLKSRSSWAELAIDCGYSDQAHMIREFRMFSGLTPNAYQARSLLEKNHCPIDPEQFSSIREELPATPSGP
ncbi:MAG: AraC family transcriptional regulator [Myxococcota bacterium]